MDSVELQPGFRVGLMFNSKEEVRKIVLNHNKQQQDMLFLETERSDLEKELWIEGYDEEERLVRI